MSRAARSFGRKNAMSRCTAVDLGGDRPVTVHSCFVACICRLQKN